MSWIVVDRHGCRFMNEYEPYMQDTGHRPFETFDPALQDYPRIPSILIGCLVPLCMTDRPENARWLLQQLLFSRKKDSRRKYSREKSEEVPLPRDAGVRQESK